VDISKDINRWLSPSNVADDLRKHLSEYMEGSCSWLIVEPGFRSVLESNESSVLRIIARPGGGKTTAAAFLVGHLTQSRSDPVLYFFCKNSDAEKNTTLHILRTILWQLLQIDDDLYSIVVQRYYQSGRSVADSQHDVGEMFNTVLQGSRLPAITMLIDALDECCDLDRLIYALSSAITTSKKPLKLILLSRDGTSFPEVSAARSETINLTAEKCQHSIAIYVRKRLKETSALGIHSHEDRLADSIIHSADGLWLFTRLLMDELQHAPSFTEIERQIFGVPQGLRNLYSTILVTKEKTFSDLQLRMAQELYLWIDRTEYIPGSLLWGREDYRVETETICSILNFSSQSRQLFDPPKLVKQLASPLLEVHISSEILAEDAAGLPYDCTTFSVDFFHQTAKQYLNGSVDVPSAVLPRSLRPRRLAALYRAVTASWYLNQSYDFKDNLQQLRERPRSGIFPNYLEMIYGLWGALKLQHLRWDLDAEEMVKAGVLCDQLTCFLSTNQCLSWIEAAVIINYAGHWTQLIDNVEDVLDIAIDPLSTIPAFHRFHCARQALMTDFAYVLASTWPEDELPPETKARLDRIPHGFYQRPLARKIMGLARQYQWLLLPPQARSSNCFYMDSRG
jgi:hypothetical protein